MRVPFSSGFVQLSIEVNSPLRLAQKAVELLQTFLVKVEEEF
jgi:hypothetical protein